jgi:hypothetical protein
MENSQYKFQKEEQVAKSRKQPQEDSVFLSSRECSHCGKAVAETADICENCGHWLLVGKCHFCYMDVAEGQKFCSECGNPPNGIVCGSCGQLSHFDFCPRCSVALTEQAEAMIQTLQESDEIQELLLSQQDGPDGQMDSSETSKKLSGLKQYISNFETKTLDTPSFKIKGKTQSDVADRLTSVERSKQELKKEQKKNSELIKKREQTFLRLQEKSKEFSGNHQAARRYFGAIKILIPKVTKRKKVIGWLCNAYHVLHPGGPHECGAPASQGGTWICENIEEKTVIEKEI